MPPKVRELTAELGQAGFSNCGVKGEMHKAKQDRLAAAGWRSGDAADFLELTEEEAAFVELKLALAEYLRELRARATPGRRRRSHAASAPANRGWPRWRRPTPPSLSTCS